MHLTCENVLAIGLALGGGGVRRTEARPPAASATMYLSHACALASIYYRQVRVSRVLAVVGVISVWLSSVDLCAVVCVCVTLTADAAHASWCQVCKCMPIMIRMCEMYQAGVECK